MNYKVTYHFGGKTQSTILSADTPEEAQKTILSQNNFRTITKVSETDEPVYGRKSEPEYTSQSILETSETDPERTPQYVTQPTVVDLSASTIEKIADAIVLKQATQNRHKPKQGISINEIDLTIGDWFVIILKASIAAIPVYLILFLVTAALTTGVLGITW
tara:strand:- start:873 stop:1355 length:483 start_codon:yes stop_codon:yes gene_type:complete